MNLYEANLIMSTAIGDYRPVKRYALFSGGHDSLVCTHVAMSMGMAEAVVHVNTGTGIPQTFQFVQDTCTRYGWPLIVMRPPLDEATGEPGAQYRKMVLGHGFPGPGRGPHHIVYVELKEKALAPLVARSKTHWLDRVLFIGGIRKQESDFRMGHAEVIHRKKAIVWCSPLINWTADDIGEYIQQHGLKRNEVSDLLHISGECLCGCFAKPDERQEIATWFPDVEERIRRLEVAAAAASVPCRWGKKPGNYWLRTRKGQLDMFLCASCQKDDTPASEEASA